MKLIVLEKARHLIHNSWLGLFIPAGIHQLLKTVEKKEGKIQPSLSHPAEVRNCRPFNSGVRP